MVVRIGTLGIGLEVDSNGTTGIILEDLDWIAAAHQCITIVELHDHRGMGVAEKGIPRRLAGGRTVIQRRELDVVVVIAGDHAVWRKFVGQFVKKVGQFEPVGVGLTQFRGNAGDDDFVIAQGLVKRNRRGQLVFAYQRQRGVPATANQPGRIENGLQFFGTVIRHPGKLNASVAHLGDGVERAACISFQFIAHRVEFECDWNLLNGCH